uniref:Putative transcriptional regulator n=1 Tax=Streptomyces versipellis TaxID=67375 RepID=A0A0B6VLQ0_9ACTN|nr:putative transcriptional regulator [Streptomyces versipellis]
MLREANDCERSLAEAQQHLERTDGMDAAAAQLQDRRKSRAVVLGTLTLAEAIAELEETRGGGGLNVVFSAARELRPWRQELIVADVHDRLFALMATA